VDFGEGLHKIGKSAFRNCIALTNVTIPDSVVEFGRYDSGSIFQDCTALTRVKIGNGIKTIPNYTFSGCVNLRSVVLGNSLEKIMNNAFFNCKKIESLKLPDSMIEIGGEAFQNCEGIKTVDFGEGLHKIGNEAFRNCIALTNVTIPDSVVEFGNSAFYNCTALTSVKIGNGLKTIPYSSFSGCENLRSVVLGNSIERINERAFYKCTVLDKAYFLGNAPTLDRDVFTDTAPTFKVYYKTGATGFDSIGYPTQSYNLATTFKTVTFNMNGGNGSTYTNYALSGKQVPAPTMPTRIGYTFVGWYQNTAGAGYAWNFATDTVNSSTTLYAKWQKNVYRVFLDARGGNVAIGGKYVNYDTEIGALPTPTLSGDTFLGWYPGINGAGPQYSATSKMPANDITMYARWQAARTAVTVIFDTQGGNFITPIAATQNAIIAKPATDPTRARYIFVGWYKESSCDTKWDFAQDKVTASTTIYAGWKSLPSYSTKPITPTGLTVSSFDGYTALITWNSNPQTFGYNLYVNGSKNNSTLINGESYLLTGLTPNTTYYLKVSAENNMGESPQSTSIPLKTKEVGISLDKTSLEMKAADTYDLIATVKLNGTGATTVTWNSSNTSVATVDRNGKVTAKAKGTTLITATSTTENTLKATCQIEVFDIVAPPSIPTNQAPSPNSVVVSWTAVAKAQSYNVYVNGVKNNTTPITTTAYTVTGLSKNTTYQIQITSVNVAGESPKSVAKSITTSNVIMGDVNGDSVITIADAMTVFQSLAGQISPLAGAKKDAADIDGNSIITIADAMKIFQFLAGEITSLS
ncbi:MAG: leucine-rich repeat protein, partial [Clostridia bacterium]